MQCESVKGEPIIDGEDDLHLSEYFTFPSLHIMLGITNKLVEELEKVWKGFHQWPQYFNLVREDYFGKTYEVSFIFHHF